MGLHGLLQGYLRLQTCGGLRRFAGLRIRFLAKTARLYRVCVFFSRNDLIMFVNQNEGINFLVEKICSNLGGVMFEIA
jgi:hypothetical protein